MSASQMATVRYGALKAGDVIRTAVPADMLVDAVEDAGDGLVRITFRNVVVADPFISRCAKAGEVFKFTATSSTS